MAGGILGEWTKGGGLTMVVCWGETEGVCGCVDVGNVRRLCIALLLDVRGP